MFLEKQKRLLMLPFELYLRILEARHRLGRVAIANKYMDFFIINSNMNYLCISKQLENNLFTI